MKKSELEKYIRHEVEIKLFDNDIVTGTLYKTHDPKFMPMPNLYIPINYYFCMDERGNPSCLFRSSHVKRLKLIEEAQQTFSIYNLSSNSIYNFSSKEEYERVLYLAKLYFDLYNGCNKTAAMLADLIGNNEEDYLKEKENDNFKNVTEL